MTVRNGRHTWALKKWKALQEQIDVLLAENKDLKLKISKLLVDSVTKLELVPEFEKRCLYEMARIEKKRQDSIDFPGEHIPRRFGFETHCVVFVDLDGLKWINDHSGEGHKGGDNILRAVANSLKSKCRKDDLIVRRGEGGDEYLLLLAGCAKKDAIRILLMVRKDFEQGIAERFPSMVGKVSFSFGVREVTLQNTVEEIAQMTTEADKSMHKWKERRKMDRRAECYDGC